MPGRNSAKTKCRVYVYTFQGWLKEINSTTHDSNSDVGQDTFKWNALDACAKRGTTTETVNIFQELLDRRKKFMLNQERQTQKKKSMNRRITFIVITCIFIAAIVVSWRISVKIKKDHERVESMQKVHELLTRTSIDTTESIGTTLSRLFSDFSFSIGKQRAELFDAKEAIQSQSSMQLECLLHQDIIDFKLKLNQVLKLYHLKEEDCTGQLDTAFNNLSYLNKPSWTFTELRTIDSVLSELNGLDATLSQLEVGILECSH